MDIVKRIFIDKRRIVLYDLIIGSERYGYVILIKDDFGGFFNLGRV